MLVIAHQLDYASLFDNMCLNHAFLYVNNKALKQLINRRYQTMLKSHRLLHRSLNFVQQLSKGQASPYVNKLYEHWSRDKASVGQSWNEYFSKVNVPTSQPGLSNRQVEQKVELMFKCYNMMRQFFFSGHQLANLDPLQLEDTKEYGKRKKYRVNFDLQSFGFAESELDVLIYFGDEEKRSFIYPFMVEKEEWSIREIHTKLMYLYNQGFAFEYVHMVSEEEKHWIEEQVEALASNKYSKADMQRTLTHLTRSHASNEFLKNKFPLIKRFGVEGNDTLISGLNALVDSCAEHCIKSLVFGMPHRGRLTTLANVFSKPMETIFAEFQNKFESNEEVSWGNSGDVKYHLGTTCWREFPNGHTMKLVMLPNPSHLETVDPLVTGKTRAIQTLNLEEGGEPYLSAMSVIIHGDASIAGQGVVYEQMQMQNLDGYGVKGTVHIVCNNQIGFTTTPIKARSGLYCTEVAKSIDAPIIHVNGDNPDLVDAVIRTAVAYRHKFKKDIVVDLIGYRRFGHNEQDQPSFTQPLMYKRIEAMVPVYAKYVEYLEKQKHFTKAEIETQYNEAYGTIEKAYLESRREVFDKNQWISKSENKMIEVTKYGRIKDTGVPLEQLKSIGTRINTLPNDLEVHPTIKKIYELRLKSIEEGKNIDFATAEALAFGSLLEEGFSVRLSGQDVERGTFSHRHCVLNDQKKDIKYYPLRQLIDPKLGHRFAVHNSHLSEYGVMGFEYGYSISDPNTLTLWEAQFGDFANGAQIIFDNYLATGETKWGVESGLVVMLPHGMDGQGPEHSSARLERYLQYLDDDSNILHHSQKQIRSQIHHSNMQVVVCSNPANYFHVLRRQLRREFRKPLILFNSKRLLKAAKAQSSLDEFKEGDRFHRLYPESHKGIRPPAGIKRVVLCYGQLYYDIIDRRAKLGKDDMAVIRVEQVAPFPYDHFKSEAIKYRNADFVIAQEEHHNQGAWQYLEPRVHAVLAGLKEEGLIQHAHVHYCGRRPSSSTAAGSAKVHNIELEKLLEKLFQY